MNKKTIIFIIICFALSWISAGVFYLCGGKLSSLVGSVFASAYMFFPLISVIITQLICGDKVLGGCGIKFKINGWWFVAWFGMAAFCVLAVFVSYLAPGASISLDSELLAASVDALKTAIPDAGPREFLAITLAAGLVAGVTVNALFAMGEETAWRGFLAETLAPVGFLKKSLLIGAIWGLWHAPLILMGLNYPNHPISGVFMMIAACTLMSPLLVFLKERSDSVVAAAIAHGTLNALAGLSLILVDGYNELLCGCVGAAGMVILLLIDVVIFFASRSRDRQRQ